MYFCTYVRPAPVLVEGSNTIVKVAGDGEKVHGEDHIDA